MIDSEIEFRGIFCENPVDWGSWEKYIGDRRKNKVFFFDFDGVIVEAGAPYGKNVWADSKVIPGAKEKIIELKQKGHTIFILTSRTSKALKDTVAILESNNIPYDKIITDIPNGQRVLINDYAPSNPYPTAEAINTKRNTLDWVGMI
jgi:biotin carboxylase